MICFIALIVFGILGIFSVKYRQIAKEAFDCVFRRITFRKCESSLDQRLKSQITGKLIKHNPKLAGFVYKRFEIISWIFTIILILSIVYSAWGLYNYAVYGNCNGKQSTSFCVFNQLLTGEHKQQEQCSLIPVNKTEMKVPPIYNDDPYLGPENASIKIIEFGCYICPYTKEAQSTIKKILETYPDIKYVYKGLPLPIHENSELAENAARCSQEQNKFWEYHNKIFELKNVDVGTLTALANELKLNMTQFNNCMIQEKYKGLVKRDYKDGILSGVYGTPTFFINNETLVGPKSFKEIKEVIEKLR